LTVAGLVVMNSAEITGWRNNQFNHLVNAVTVDSSFLYYSLYLNMVIFKYCYMPNAMLEMFIFEYRIY
jgi:hypothetical protein